MAIGSVTKEEFDKEFGLGEYSKPKQKESHPKVEIIERAGRKEGDNNVPDPLRQIIGETQLMDGRKAALKMAKEFGISPSSVSAYAHGATSTTTYDTPSNSISSFLKKSKERASKRASKTLNSALGAITQEKLDYSDAKDLATIAKDMAVVIKNLEPSPDQSNPNQTTGPQFVIFAPTFKKEDSFDVIDVRNSE